MCTPSRGSLLSSLTVAGIVLISSAATGCGRERAGPPREPPPAPTSANAIPVAPLSGKLLGQAFSIRSARYYVDQRPGYQKIVLKLYGIDSPAPCTDLTPRKPPEVWLRHNGPQRIATGQTAIGLDHKAPWEVHYQVQQNGRWVGNGDARALFVIRKVDPDMKVHGELSACFRDPSGSCVSGQFVANYCRIWIDSPVRGSDVMEHPPRDSSAPSSAQPSAAPSSEAAAAGSAGTAPAPSATGSGR